MPQSASDLERPIKMTPTIMATMQAASAASPAIDTETLSPRSTMPSAIPAIGSAAAIGGKEKSSRAAWNALCEIAMPTIAAPITT